jgi:protein arginine kinase
MSSITDLVAADCPWLASPGSSRGVVVSSRIRLARTWASYSFHRKLSRKRQQELTDRLLEHLLAVDAAGTQWQIQALPELERLALVERQVISRELASAKRPGGVHVHDGLVVMVNEEDHLRLQVIGPGLCLGDLLQRAVAVDQALESRVAWAVHPQFGYLTACHTNVGTGLRASVMLHLPALSETGELQAVLRAAGKLHLAVRGFHGEGTEASGHTYQLSNARTLGGSEEFYAELMVSAVERVVAAEHLARAALLEKARSRLEDKIFRAWGLLTHARSLTSEEANDALSWIRLGTALDVLTEAHWAIPTHRRWRLLDYCAVHSQPAHLQLLHAAGETLEAPDRDRLRATLMRQWLTASGTKD